MTGSRTISVDITHLIQQALLLPDPARDTLPAQSLYGETPERTKMPSEQRRAAAPSRL